MRIDLDRFDDALRRLLSSPPVDPSTFETRHTEEARLYQRLIDASRTSRQRAEPATEKES